MKALNLLILNIGLLVVPQTWGDSIFAASCSLSDVSTAVNAASPGDSVILPEGTSSWAAGLTIDKSITMVGAGPELTIISHNGTSTLVKVALSTDGPVRISGICFRFSTNNSGGKAILVNGKSDGSFPLTSIRIDHNRFEKGTRTVQVNGWTYGVVDHNEFVNCNIAVGITGDNNHSWQRPIVAGTSESLFIEDNVFAIDNDADREPNEMIYHQEGARSVTRHNVFDATAYTNGNALFFDSHGNQNYFAGSGDFRGQPLIEVYGNTLNVHHTYRLFHIRGGSVLMYDNTATVVSGTPVRIKLTDEETWQTAFFSPLRTEWNAEDQVMNSFFWNNTLNGVLIADVTVGDSDAEFIQRDRDYFMHAPAAVGGRASYIGRPGGQESFAGSGPNAYYPYAPFTYPHPVILGASLPARPASPSALRVKQ